MTDKNIETLRNIVTQLSELRIEVSTSENDELDPVWQILIKTCIQVREIAEEKRVEL